MTTEQKHTLQLLREDFAKQIFEKTGLKGIVIFSPEEINKKPIAPEVVTDVVCRVLNINYEDVFKDTRVRPIVEARHISMYLCCMYSELTLPKCGRFFNRDHSTVIHAKRVIGGYLQMDVDFRAKFAGIEAELLLAAETFNN